MASAAHTVKMREGHDALQRKAEKRARKARKQASETDVASAAAAAAAADAEAEAEALAQAAADALAAAELAHAAAEFGGDGSDSDNDSDGDGDSGDVVVTGQGEDDGEEEDAAAAAAPAASDDNSSSDDDDDDEGEADPHAQQRLAEEEARISMRAAGGGKGPAYFAAIAKQVAEEEEEKKKKKQHAESKGKSARGARSPRRGPAVPAAQPPNRATRIEPCDPTKIVHGERLLHCGVEREVISGDCLAALPLNSKGLPDWNNLPVGVCAHILTKIVGSDPADEAGLESFVWGKDTHTLVVVPHSHGIDMAKAALRVPTAKPAIKEAWVRAGVQNIPPHSSIYTTTLPMSTLRMLRAQRNGAAPPDDSEEIAQRQAEHAAASAAATLPIAATAAGPAVSRKRKASGGSSGGGASASASGGSSGSSASGGAGGMAAAAAGAHPLPLLSRAARELVDRTIEPRLRQRAQENGSTLESEFLSFYRTTEQVFNRNLPSEQPDPLTTRMQEAWNREHKNESKDVGEFVKWQLARVMLLADPASNQYLLELRNKFIAEDSATVDFSRYI